MTTSAFDGLLETIGSFSRSLPGKCPAASESPDAQAIREKAYLLWEEAGRPESDGVEFWLRAEQDLQSA